MPSSAPPAPVADPCFPVTLRDNKEARFGGGGQKGCSIVRATRRPPSFPAIDIHAHMGAHEFPWMGQEDPGAFIRCMRKANVVLAVVSHSGAIHARSRGTREKYNRVLLRHAETHPQILVWWVTDPTDARSLALARQMAPHPRVVGFKVHPRCHGYPFARHGGAILDLAGQVGVPVLTHAGNRNDMPAHIVAAASSFPDVRLILAHFGNCAGHLGHLRALAACTSANVFTDTSSAVSIQKGLIEMGVRELGAGRFLFGSDYHAYHLSAQYYRIAHAELAATQRRAILFSNAARHILKPHQAAALKDPSKQ